MWRGVLVVEEQRVDVPARTAGPHVESPVVPVVAVRLCASGPHTISTDAGLTHLGCDPKLPAGPLGHVDRDVHAFLGTHPAGEDQVLSLLGLEREAGKV